MDAARAIVAASPSAAGARSTASALAVSLLLHGAVASAALWWPLSDNASSASAPVEVVFWAEPAGSEIPVQAASFPAPPSAEAAPLEVKDASPVPPEEPPPVLVEQAPAIVEPPPPPPKMKRDTPPRRVSRPAPAMQAARPPDAATATGSAALESTTAREAATSAAPASSALTTAPTQLAALSAAVDLPSSPPLVTQARFRSPPAPPAYPRRAIDLGQEGEVIVRALVGSDGESREIRIFRSSGVPLLDEAAVRAVKRWAFEAAQINGRAIEAWVEVPVRFQLRTVL